MAQKLDTVTTDDQEILAAGYTPRLQRSLGFLSSFAISFSYMSVLTGIFANFSFVIGKAGPFGIWTWILASIGQFLVACVFAEMAGRIPLTGCSYNWNTRLGNPTLGWFAGWMALFAYSVGVAAVTVTLIPIVESLLGMSIDDHLAPFISVALVFLQAALNIFGVKVAARINLLAVILEMAALIIFGVLLLIPVFAGRSDPTPLFRVPQTPTPYAPAFLMAFLLGSWTLLGFEGAADVAEETVNVRVVAPRGIIQSLVTCSVLGFVFVFALAAAIPNLPDTLASKDPATYIVKARLGEPLAEIFLIVVTISVLACSLVNMTGASRVMFAMARDARFPFHSWLSQVSDRRVPRNAIWTVAAVASLFILFTSSNALYGSGAVLFTLFYFITICSYLLAFKKLGSTTTFSLGSLRAPVASLSAIWLLFEICILTIPTDFHPTAVATGIVIVIGIFLFALTGRASARSYPL